jgi:hypothetical protein
LHLGCVLYLEIDNANERMKVSNVFLGWFKIKVVELVDELKKNTNRNKICEVEGKRKTDRRPAPSFLSLLSSLCPEQESNLHSIATTGF